MSLASTVSRFAKSGDLHSLGRRFRNLEMEARRRACICIDAGISAEKALKYAKEPDTCRLCNSETLPGEDLCPACQKVTSPVKGFSAGGR